MKIDPGYWNKFDPSRAFSAGVNHLRLVPEMLYDAYPSLRSYKIGIFDKDDIGVRYASGWIFLLTEHFPDSEDCARLFPERFRLEIAPDGKIKFRDQWIMIIPKDFYNERERLRLDADEARFQKEANPGRPVVTQHGTVDEGHEYEEETKEIVNDEPVKRGPGRPKNKGSN